MIYPKGIIEFIDSRPDLTNRFGSIVAANRSLNVTETPVDETTDAAFIDYMFTSGFLENVEIRRFVFFVSTMTDIFHHVLGYFDRTNPSSTHKDDIRPAGTHPLELLHHALYIYYLDSYGVAGDVVECGTYKGFSACCLSWACDFLGRRLVSADSFEGLPANTTDPYYKKGDFKGTLGEVQANMHVLGKGQSVDFLKGFFNASLAGYKRNICLLWFDVDLYESTMDILHHLMPNLSPGGVIISHELFAERDFADHQLLPTIGPAKAISEFFSTGNLDYKAQPLVNGSGLIVPGADKGKHILWSETAFDQIVAHAGRHHSPVTDPRIADFEQQICSLQHQLDTTTRGMSFRIGRLITWPLRYVLKRP